MARQPAESDMAERRRTGEPAGRRAQAPRRSGDSESANVARRRRARAARRRRSRSSRSSARPRRGRARSRRRSPTRSRPRSSRPTRCRSTAACRSSRTSRRVRLVSSRSATLAEEMSVGAFASLAHAEIDELVERNGAAVVAGGTGLYLRAALADLDLPPTASRRGARADPRRGRPRPDSRASPSRERSIQMPPPPCTRTTCSGSCGRSSSPSPATRSSAGIVSGAP